jgi:hypothetical protein
MGGRDFNHHLQVLMAVWQQEAQKIKNKGLSLAV